jgi:hypothetical protein
MEIKEHRYTRGRGVGVRGTLSPKLVHKTEIKPQKVDSTNKVFTTLYLPFPRKFGKNLMDPLLVFLNHTHLSQREKE